MKRFILLLPLIFAGCAHRNVALTYTPSEQPVSSERIEIALDSLADSREIQDKIGVFRNVYYMPILSINSTQPVSTWVTYALQSELENSGCTVAMAEEYDGYKIVGHVNRVFLNGYFLNNIDIDLSLSLLKDNEPLFQRDYHAHHRQNLKISDMSLEFDAPLRDICQQFIVDIQPYLAPNHEPDSALNLVKEN